MKRKKKSNKIKEKLIKWNKIKRNHIIYLIYYNDFFFVYTPKSIIDFIFFQYF